MQCNIGATRSAALCEREPGRGLDSPREAGRRSVLPPRRRERARLLTCEGAGEQAQAILRRARTWKPESADLQRRRSAARRLARRFEASPPPPLTTPSAAAPCPSASRSRSPRTSTATSRPPSPPSASCAPRSREFPLARSLGTAPPLRHLSKAHPCPLALTSSRASCSGGQPRPGVEVRSPPLVPRSPRARVERDMELTSPYSLAARRLVLSSSSSRASSATSRCAPLLPSLSQLDAERSS